MATSQITTLKSKTGSETSFPLGTRVGSRPKSSVALQKPSMLPVEASQVKSKFDLFFSSSLRLLLLLFPFILLAVAVMVAISR